ncbi:unnamed protein product [Linum tenue]|uniref:ABC transporter domain-containing protein n=1 Tax=Linum tenue TaxID=586396 RepID=A0AAV0LYR9_9ROSI|nr:unnamed protein product [Linum tenue]
MDSEAETTVGGSCLVWQELSVTLASNNFGSHGNGGSSTGKYLVNGLTGLAQSHRIMAVMGPSGSGKSTFLDALAGRLTMKVAMAGKVELISSCPAGSGTTKKKIRSSPVTCRDVSYVTQEDVFLGTLTVKETLSFGARLRLPGLTKTELDEVIEDTMAKMGLEECADTTIGNWHLRGISGGERRRLSIGVEILAQPLVLCLDEATTGLDSAASFFVVQALRNIARDGKIVVCSIHQPTNDVFRLFDDLLLISCGEAVYFGECQGAVKFFAESGFPCPTRRNPPDHFLRCITPEFDQVLAALKQTQRMNHAVRARSSRWLAERDNRRDQSNPSEEVQVVYLLRDCNEKDSRTRITTRCMLLDFFVTKPCYQLQPFQLADHISFSTQQEKHDDGSQSSSEVVPVKRRQIGKKQHHQWWSQFRTLTHRSSLHMCRDLGYYWLRIFFYIMVALSTGTLEFDIGTSSAAVIARGKVDGFLYGLMICLSIGGLPFFLDEIKAFRGEREGGYYGEAVYVLSNFLSSLPFTIFISISSGSILYSMVKFHPGFSHLLYFCINLFFCISVSEACVFVTASLVSNPLPAMGTAIGVTVLNLMPSIVFRPLPDLPKIFWRYPLSYISYAAWGTQGNLKNDMMGLEFDSAIPGRPKITGEFILTNTYGMNLRYSKWRDVAALFCLLLAYRVLLVFTLHYKQRISSPFRRTQPNRGPKPTTIQQA